MSDEQANRDPCWQPRNWRPPNPPAGAPNPWASFGSAGAWRDRPGPVVPSGHANGPAGPSGNPFLRAQIGLGPASRAGDRPDWPRPVLPTMQVYQGPGGQNTGGPAAEPWTEGQPRRNRPFRPMDAIVMGRSLNSDLTPEEREALGFSRHYQGDPLNPRNRSANIPENESTSLYIQHLPPNMTEKKLLDELQRHGPFGKVNQTWVRPQDPNRGHDFSAAKLVMFERYEAERVFNFVRNGGLVFDGTEAIIRWNTQRVQARSVTDAKHWYMTRALKIWGPMDLVSVKSLYDHWSNKIQFTTQNVYLVYEEKGIRSLVWVFASMRHQAELAYLALKEWNSHPEVKYEYAADPLEMVPEVEASFTSLLHLVPALNNFNRAASAQAPDGIQAPTGPALASNQQQQQLTGSTRNFSLPMRPAATSQQPPVGPAQASRPPPVGPASGVQNRLPRPDVPAVYGGNLPGLRPGTTANGPSTQRFPILRGPSQQLTQPPRHPWMPDGRAPIPNYPPGQGPSLPRLRPAPPPPPPAVPVPAPAPAPAPVTPSVPDANRVAEEEEERLGLRGPDSLPRQIPPRRSPYPNSEEGDEFCRVQEHNQRMQNMRPGTFW